MIVTHQPSENATGQPLPKPKPNTRGSRTAQTHHHSYKLHGGAADEGPLPPLPPLLCCCEYIDRNDKRNHLAACCCNCVDFDQACDRLICCQPVSARTTHSMLLTLQDRMRVPCPGGARRVSLSSCLPVIVLPVAVVVAALRPQTMAAVFVGIPLFLWRMYRYLGRTEPRTKFFLVWNMFSVLMLWILFEVTVPLLEVLPEENFCLLTLMTISVSCFYETKRRAPQNYVSRPMSEDGDDLDDENATMLQIDDDHSESSDDELNTKTCHDRAKATLHLHNPAICKHCHKYMPPRAFHCPICRTCIARHDHHNVWLDCCIGESNHRLYFAGTLFGLWAALVGSNLALTTICHPMLIGSVLGVHVFVPDDCSDIFDAAWEFTLCFVGSMYAMLMACWFQVDLIRQIVQITSGTTWAEYKRGIRHKWNVIQNWTVFVCLMRG